MTASQSSAVQRARTPGDEPPPTGLEARALALVNRLVEIGIEGIGPIDGAAEVADAALAASSSVEDAVDDVVRSHTRLAAAGGFVTGLGGFVTLPIALPANVLEFYAIATRMVAAIARLRGYDISTPHVRSAILLTLAGTDSRSVLSRARVSSAVTDAALSQVPEPALMLINKGIGVHLLSQVGKRSFIRLGRALPVAGGAVGATMDWWLLRKVAEFARAEFPVTTET
ncbi:MAG: EcsC family protein [Actinomycetales bacterium]